MSRVPWWGLSAVAAIGLLPAAAIAGGPSVDVWTDRGADAVYQPGETIELRARCTIDAHLLVYEIDAEGYVHVLFPYRGNASFVEGGRTLSIPSPDASEQLVVHGPVGQGYIVALASRETMRDLPWYLRPYDAQGAGLKRVTSYWKGGKARVDTMATTGNTRHYASGSGSLIACRQNGSAFQCEEDTPPQGLSFRQNLGPDYQRQLGIAHEAGGHPTARKILGQVVDCWSYNATEAVVESQTCVNEVGAVLYYSGGTKDDPYQEIAVAYTTDVSDADVNAPPAPPRKPDFIPVPTTTTAPPATTAPR